jgi:uncharacterized protein (TIGR03437 family)
MIEMASKSCITKVSRVFGRKPSYTSRVKEGDARSEFVRSRECRMTKALLKFATILSVTSCFVAAAFQTQNLGSMVRIYAVPDGAQFSVDGHEYLHAVTAIWPAGSKHALAVSNTVQHGSNIRYLFKGWQSAGGLLPGGNNVTVTADPSLKEYYADFQGQYLLTLSFFECPDPKFCPSPGTIYLNGGAINSDRQMYVDAGSVLELMAVPNPGYVFTGWAPAAGQTVQGFLNSVPMNGPMVVRPQFQIARQVRFATVPDGLEVLADRTPVTTPSTLEWGWESAHTVGVTSPQMDRYGKWWAFASWSDGGALSHTYKVESIAAPVALTATFVPAAVTQIQTSPSGLAIKVDGRENWASYDFIWGVGEKHRLEAPLQQTSSDGRIWKFAAWSTGAAAAHEYTVPAGTVPGGSRVTATYTPLAAFNVSSTLAGVTIQVDGEDCVVPCQVLRAPGETIRVAAPGGMSLGDGARADFTGWPGSGSTARDGSYTLAAGTQRITLEYRLMNRLVTAASPPEGVSWRFDPVSPDGYYDSFATVTLSVSPKPGFRFKRWNGDLSGSTPYGALVMNEPRSVQAMLERVPYVASSGVANAASGLADPGVAPGSIASIFGANFTTETAVGSESPLAQSLGGVSVRVGERFLPLFFVSPAQINVQVPPDLGEGAQTLVISSLGLPDIQAAFRVVRNAPGLFGQMVEGELLAVAAHEDGSAVSPDSPARPGERIVLFGTGFGPAQLPRPLGFPAPAEPRLELTDAVAVQIGETSISPLKTYAVPGSIGVDGILFQVPDDAAAGKLSLSAAVERVVSNQVLVPIR